MKNSRTSVHLTACTEATQSNNPTWELEFVHRSRSGDILMRSARVFSDEELVNAVIAFDQHREATGAAAYLKAFGFDAEVSNAAVTADLLTDAIMDDISDVTHPAARHDDFDFHDLTPIRDVFVELAHHQSPAPAPKKAVAPTPSF